jgi:hypothetical protein
MKTRKSKSIVLGYGAALGFAGCMTAAMAVMAQEAAQKPDGAVQKTDEVVPKSEVQKPAPSALVQRQAELTPATGSNIRRFRAPDPTLPLMELDRGYIDRSGATNAAELLRTVPGVQTPVLTPRGP